MSRLFRDVDRGVLIPQGSVVCIGAFDGLHLGHQALVRHAVSRAREFGLYSVAVTFDPLPREFFARDVAPSRLMSTRSRIDALYAQGIDAVLLLRFDARLSGMSPVEFVERVLADALRAREVWVGPDFRFGRARAGDLAVLREIGAHFGFDAHSIEPIDAAGSRASSTRIRDALAEGRFDAAAESLGRSYLIEGRVVRGKQLGRTLGYPTANLRLPQGRPPLSGIFATRVHGLGPTPLPSVSSLGTRPTVGGVEPLLETHIFDFDADLYTRRIGIEFVAKLRDELKFDGLPALVAQMDRDAAQAREILSPTHTRRTA
ncbi:bifunctional riboflavin kinase/FAD synthetase [Lysobacter sp. TY2-98]|uniref:bifunctional riboflavin kinase/FAD synthetase n=1 Tax=Lysobacter sp. TY2-98 TaxID=2290922 RepID=UPI000E1FC641|nr:bifunctional riboflavin kinase/FAD synthetase [Lysobacter sp. TY2-98]AXK71996.1 bifunctional riboflavin kinase/FAD synthetase [Lysobacter sp. TY2-98]